MTDPDFKSPWERGKASDNGGRGSDPTPSAPRRPYVTILKWVAIALAVTLVLIWIFPDVIVTDRVAVDLIYDLLLLGLIGSSLLLHVMSNPGQALRHAALWVLIGSLLALGYSIWSGMGRLGSELNPVQGRQVNGGISFPATLNGPFVIRGAVNGEPIVFIVDTGASDVVLPAEEARRIGIDPDKLDYTLPFRTASGMTYGARIRLEEMRLGPITMRGVRAAVIREGLDHALLGMSFLGRLSSYQVSNDVLTLYP